VLCPKFLVFSPPENDSFRKDLRFTHDVFLFFKIFFHSRNLRDTWADRREIVQDGQYWAEFYNAGPKFSGVHPKKISGAKNMQNLARFWTTSKFGGEYLQKGWRYSKSDSHSVYGVSSCVRRNKSGEVWSSDLGDLDVKSYPPKAQFSEDHISAPRGCCAAKFLHALENDEVLLPYPPPGTEAPLTTFFKGGQKLA